MEKTKTLYQKLFEIKKANITLQRNTKAYNYKYATLDQIQEKLNPELEKQGLLIIHYMDGGFVITSIVDIDSDQSIESYIELSNWTKAQDKEWATVDRNNNNIYVTWTEFDDYGSTAPEDRSRILFSKSENAGEAWSSPITLCQTDGDCVDDDYVSVFVLHKV